MSSGAQNLTQFSSVKFQFNSYDVNEALCFVLSISFSLATTKTGDSESTLDWVGLASNENCVEACQFIRFTFLIFSSSSFLSLPSLPSFFLFSLLTSSLSLRDFSSEEMNVRHLRLGDDGQLELRRSVCMDLASATSMTTSGMKNDTSDE